MSEADLRNAIRGALAQFDAAVEAAIRRELAEPLDLSDGDSPRFQVDGFSSSISLIQTENGIFDGDPVLLAVCEIHDEDEPDVYSLINEELYPWFADRWTAVNGPGQYRHAYAFYHWGGDRRRYDLEQRRWCEVGEVWPD